MFAPVAFVTTAPAVPSSTATASRRVVVVLPFVPLTSATDRPAARRSRSDASTASPARPPSTVPLPTRSARETALTDRVAATARRARGGRTVGPACRSPAVTGQSAVTGRSTACPAGTSGPAPPPSAGDRARASAGSSAAIAAISVSVSATASVSPSGTGRPTRTRTVGGWASAATSGSLADRGQTCSVPHRPTGTTGAPVAAARRAVPVLPCSTGSKNASPRGIVPCGRTMTTSPARSAASAACSGRDEPLPRSTGMPPIARATQPSTGASNSSCLPRKRTGRPSRAATSARAATSK